MTAAPRFAVPRNDRRTVRRPGTVYLHLTWCVDRRGMPTGVVENGYVGQARVLARRTAQHAGEIPQRSGKVVESPWFDVKTAREPVVLESGTWTDVELDEREQAWIAKLQPRYNDRDNPRRDKIRKLEARRHRDARDIARGLVPRQWEPVRVDPVVPSPPRRVWPVVKAILGSPWTWWAVAWASTAVTAWIVVGSAVDGTGQELAAGWRLLLAAALATACVGRLWWWATGRRKWRRFKRRLR